MTESEDERFERLSRDRQVRPLPKRFYKDVSISPENDILLDGRAVKTPMKAQLRLPTLSLAQAVADEWRSQKDVINPHSMPFTKLANTAIDRPGEHAAAIRSDIVTYAGNDLVCYRAGHPDDLVLRQHVAWDPVLAWAEQLLGAQFVKTFGLKHVDQPPDCLAAVARRLVAVDDFSLVSLHAMTTLAGSALLALMVAEGALPAAQAWAAASLDELWQAEKWGRDEEAAARNAGRENEFKAAAAFINLARGLP